MSSSQCPFSKARSGVVSLSDRLRTILSLPVPRRELRNSAPITDAIALFMEYHLACVESGTSAWLMYNNAPVTLTDLTDHDARELGIRYAFPADQSVDPFIPFFAAVREGFEHTGASLMNYSDPLSLQYCCALDALVDAQLTVDPAARYKSAQVNWRSFAGVTSSTSNLIAYLVWAQSVERAEITPLMATKLSASIAMGSESHFHGNIGMRVNHLCNGTMQLDFRSTTESAEYFAHGTRTALLAQYGRGTAEGCPALMAKSVLQPKKSVIDVLVENIEREFYSQLLPYAQLHRNRLIPSFERDGNSHVKALLADA